MGSPSFSTHRGLVHWKGLLLVVSLLTFWSLPTTDQLNIVATYCTKGEDAVLHIHNKPPWAVAFVWYKGEGVDKNNIIAFFIPTLSFHLSFSGNNRTQILNEDGSLLLKNAIMMDAGMYTVVAHFPNSEIEIGSGELAVFEPLKVPLLLASRYQIMENKENVALTCYTNAHSVQWLFNDRHLKLTDRMKLTKDGRRITINPFTREDAGDYKCKASNPIMWVESEPIHLNVQ